MSTTYKVKINQFEGPFDLLLYFIRRDELDIYDIPISQITEDFLAYIRQLEALDLEVASEFILVAATLMRIKAKMLIPRKELDEEGQEIDPREDLVKKLLEYKQYKKVIGDFSELEKARAERILRGNTLVEVKELAKEALVDVELETLTTYKLFNAFRNVLEKFKNREDRYIHQIVKYPYTLELQKGYLNGLIEKQASISFDDIFLPLDNRMHAIVTFLALLEMINNQELRINAGLTVNSFYVEKRIQEDATEEE